MKTLSSVGVGLCLLLSFAVFLAAAPPDTFLQPALSAPGQQPNTITSAYAPDRVIMKLTPDVAMGVMGRGGKRVPRGLAKAMEQARARRAGPLLPHLWQTGAKGPQRAADRANAIRAEFPRRAARAPWNAPVPDIENILVLQLDPGSDVMAAVARLQREPDVVYAEPDYSAQYAWVPNDPYYNSSGSWGQAYADQWGVHAIGAETAWDAADGSGMVIAIVDSGVDYTHPDLQGQLWHNPDEIPGNGIDDDGNSFVDDVFGWDFVGPVDTGSPSAALPDNDPMDYYGHGTLCAGIAAAATDNGLGIAAVAPAARIMALKTVGDDNTSGSFYEVYACQAIYYAADNGADVIDCSFASPGKSDAMADTAKYALLTGCVVVGATGNYGTTQMMYPAVLPGVVAVGASDPGDALSGFSSWGAWVDLLAPGTDILTTRSRLGVWDPQPGIDSDYIRVNGTSMAAPFVSGAAAVLLSYDPNLSPEQVRQALRASACDVGAAGWDRATAWGRLDLANSLVPTHLLSVELTSPTRYRLLSRLFAYAEVVPKEVEIHGKVWGTGLASYELSYGPGYDPALGELVPIASGVSPVDGLLAVWDTSSLPAGSYTLFLTATSDEGFTFGDSSLVLVDHGYVSGWPTPSTFSLEVISKVLPA